MANLKFMAKAAHAERAAKAAKAAKAERIFLRLRLDVKMRLGEDGLAAGKSLPIPMNMIVEVEKEWVTFWKTIL